MYKTILLFSLIPFIRHATAFPATGGQLSLADQQLPIVDLGYEQHQASLYNDAYEFYQFSDIRYAQSPVGPLRFRRPAPPVANRSDVQRGNETRTCPQGSPRWLLSASGAIRKYGGGAPFTLQGWEDDIANGTVPNIDLNAHSSEDCLFLDVYVPPKALKQACNDKSQLSRGAAVLVWIHGGGFVQGSKNDHNPADLIKYGALEDHSGMIFVALNYRLGALGFLASDDVEKNGDLNAGLLDQRMALQWVQDNIHRFGGDASRVTVIGESGGAGSILLHMTALGNDAQKLFAQAITQSTATLPAFAESDAAYQDLLTVTNTTSIADMRALTSVQIIGANAKIVAQAPHNTFLYNQVLDRNYLRTTPPKAFSSGKFPKGLKILSGINSFEGGFFFDPTVRNETAFVRWTGNLLPSISLSKHEYVAQTLYPPVFDGSLGYVDYDTRQMLVWADAVMHCNSELQLDYFANSNIYAYDFSVTPGFHIQDLSYTFSDGNPNLLPAPDAAYTLQRAIASFAVHGVPSLYTNSSGASPTTFPTWNAATRQTVNITSTGTRFGVRTVGSNATRCHFWQTGLFEST